jgi:hypothetical protein
MPELILFELFMHCISCHLSPSKRRTSQIPPLSNTIITLLHMLYIILVPISQKTQYNSRSQSSVYCCSSET